MWNEPNVSKKFDRAVQGGISSLLEELFISRWQMHFLKLTAHLCWDYAKELH